jgi:hypothetical protein
MTTATLVPGCEPYGVACPAIAQVIGVSVNVTAEYAPAVDVLHLKACQDGMCQEADLELHPGSVSIDQGCTPDGVCSATASPDGTKVGTLMLETLTESPMTVTASGTSPAGSALPVQNLEFRPRATYPFGEQCGKFIVASVTLDATGLREQI